MPWENKKVLPTEHKLEGMPENRRDQIEEENSNHSTTQIKNSTGKKTTAKDGSNFHPRCSKVRGHRYREKSAWAGQLVWAPQQEHLDSLAPLFIFHLCQRTVGRPGKRAWRPKRLRRLQELWGEERLCPGTSLCMSVSSQLRTLALLQISTKTS